MINEGKIEPVDSGLDGVYMWIGPNPTNHGKRIKISNKKHTFDESDCFCVSIPKLDIVVGENKLFKDKELENIYEFININLDVINDLYDKKIDNITFINNLKPKKINEYKINEYRNPISLFNYKLSIAKYRDIYLVDEDAEYMDIFFDTSHNIKDITLYFGQSSIKGEVLVKVCNNKLPDAHNIFTIYVKEKIIRGNIKISDDKLFQILQLISNNEDLIAEYSDVNTDLNAVRFGKRLIL